ncbi:hexose kinase [Psychromicrobium lacuslunae]|uniref:1-phosphofructokinase family hexose kinase n=1 Tax=Psychromicrobium lacuslunae TaxID=1618207 RepID=UPI002D218F88|nr:hexose kinase [Psychromicrobium lacuslunae]
MTPNPAIDLTYRVNGLVPGESHRVPAPLNRAGGKGINVSRVLHSQGISSRIVATAGGQTGEQLATELRSDGLSLRLIPVQSDTRRTIALVDEASGLTSIFNERGLELDAAEWQSVADVVADELVGAQILVASGSLPPGAPADFYPGLIALARHLGVSAVIDTSGAGLLSAASAGAELLKPNRAELLEATGERELSAGARVLLRLGAKRLLVSDGENGMLAFENGVAGHLSARLPEPLSGNPTGAGDAAVAGAASIMAEARQAAKPVVLEQMLRRAAAWGSAAVLMPGAGEISERWTELEATLILEEHH